MPSSGLVSIIIPAFNAESFVGQAITSALGQSHQPIEVIVINDGSCDGTGAVIRQMAMADERVIAIDLDTRQGVAAARNAGLKKASGAWVALLDADDIFAPERIERLLSMADCDTADLIADNLLLRDFVTGAALGLAFPSEWMVEKADITIRYILERDIAGLYRREMAFIKPLIRRRLLVENQILYHEDITAGEDLLFYIDCLRAGGRMKFVPDALYSYSVRPGSISSHAGANLSCLRVNQILQRQVQHADPAIADLLRLRGTAITYELLVWYIRSARIPNILQTARAIPPGFLLRKLVRAVRRRLGLPSVNPTKRELDRIRARRGDQPTAGLPSATMSTSRT